MRASVKRRPEIQEAGPHFEDDVRKALYASKIVAYAQGFDAIVAGALEYGWNIDKGAIARIWRGGCIIRASSSTASSSGTNATRPSRRSSKTSTSPTPSPTVKPWRRVVATAVLSGIPVPGSASALSYYDSLASDRLPGVVDPGPARLLWRTHLARAPMKRVVFHTLWSGDRSEVAIERTTWSGRAR